MQDLKFLGFLMKLSIFSLRSSCLLQSAFPQDLQASLNVIIVTWHTFSAWMSASSPFIMPCAMPTDPRRTVPGNRKIASVPRWSANQESMFGNAMDGLVEALLPARANNRSLIARATFVPDFDFFQFRP